MRKIGYIASGIVVGSSLMIATSAIAGGFAIREQSTTGLGVAFADSAAGSDLSSMYWNPAAVTVEDGLNSLSSYTAIMGDTTVTPTPVPFAGPSSDIDRLGLLAGSYYNYQLNNQMYVGMSINAPIGLVTQPDKRFWAGAPHNQKSEVFSLNATPTVGYKITPELSVAAGLQVQYTYIRLASVNGLTTNAFFKGEDVGVGFTLGALYKNKDTGTSIGLGYRSTIDHSLDGVLVNEATPTYLSISAQLDTPEMITASIRQQLSPTFALMANFEFANWSRLKELHVSEKITGTTLARTDFSWDDSWFGSVGAEFAMSEKITGRAGLGYEKSPVPDATRGARLPDSDRIWLSFGGSYKWSDTTTLDFGYSHIFFEDSTIAIAAGETIPPRPALNADVTNSANILSVGLRHKF